MSGLEKTGESGWPYGAFQSGAVEAIPVGAAARLFDGYWPEDGMPERRGGSEYKSNATFGTTALRWLWDGYLAGGQRTLFVDSGADDLGQLGADDASPATVYSSADISDPVAFAVGAGILYVAKAAGGIVAFAGSRKTTNYSTGTVTVTQDSRTVTGVGTAWSANADAGMILTTTTNERVPVKSIDSNTTLTLTVPWAGPTAAGTAYMLNVVINAVPTETFTALAFVGNRLAGAVGSRVYFSSPGEPISDWNFTEDFHAFDGDVIGLGAVRDTLIVFTTQGVHAVYNMSLDLTDANGNPQQRSELIARDLILWGKLGLASWRGALVVPALDGVWLMDAVGQPQLISSAFRDAYVELPSTGALIPGQAAVFDGHYFLPVQSGSAAAGTMLVCRLTPNAAGRAMLWSEFVGHGGGGNVMAVAARGQTAAAAPMLLGAGEDRRVLELPFLRPTAVHADDADGVDHVMELQTRAYPSGNGNVNTVRFVTLSYTLTDAASDNPTVDCYYAIDGETTWTAATAGGTGAETSGTIGKKLWRIDRDCRIIQFRFRTANAAATAKFRGVELQVHRSNRV